MCSTVGGHERVRNIERAGLDETRADVLAAAHFDVGDALEREAEAVGGSADEVPTARLVSARRGERAG